MSPLTTIADAIARFMPEGDGGQDGALNLVRAEEIIRALRRDDYTIYRGTKIDPPGYPD